jgi:hypothetical protein
MNFKYVSYFAFPFIFDYDAQLTCFLHCAVISSYFNFINTYMFLILYFSPFLSPTRIINHPSIFFYFDTFHPLNELNIFYLRSHRRN